MKNYFLLIVLFIFVASSCTKDNENLIFSSSKPIVFNKMKVGQKSHYVLLKGDLYKSNDNLAFSYTKDTMVVEIVSQDANGYLVEEYLTPGSASLNGEYHVALPDQTFSYYFQIKDEEVRLQAIDARQVSRVFFLNHHTLPLEKNYDLEVEIEGWKTTLPYKAEYIMAHAQEYTLFDIEYDFLNVMIDNEGMKTNQPGYTHVYAPKFGVVRTSQYSPETDKGFGWDLIR